MAWQRKERKKMEDILNLISEVGVPIAGALVMGVFIFLIMKQLFSGLIDDINQIKMFSTMLITRVRAMNNDMIRIDASVSAALGLTPDLDRMSRAENFVEDGSIDVRRD